jgi:hypothetical protein
MFDKFTMEISSKGFEKKMEISFHGVEKSSFLKN